MNSVFAFQNVTVEYIWKYADFTLLILNYERIIIHWNYKITM